MMEKKIQNRKQKKAKEDEIKVRKRKCKE